MTAADAGAWMREVDEARETTWSCRVVADCGREPFLSERARDAHEEMHRAALAGPRKEVDVAVKCRSPHCDRMFACAYQRNDHERMEHGLRSTKETTELPTPRPRPAETPEKPAPRPAPVHPPPGFQELTVEYSVADEEARALAAVIDVMMAPLVDDADRRELVKLLQICPPGVLAAVGRAAAALEDLRDAEALPRIRDYLEARFA